MGEMEPQVLGGRYRLGKTLGFGGFGEVVQAYDVTTRRLVAIKILKKEFAQDQAVIRRFEREIVLLAELSSPAIVAVFDLGRTGDGRPYLVMERLTGADCSVVCQAPGVTVANLCRWLGGAALGLAEAHHVGIVHRDVKPSNLFLCFSRVASKDYSAMEVKLIDFGISKLLSANIKAITDAAIGTPLYMAPEQIDGRADVDGRADQWGLAVTLFRLLTGNFPFCAKEASIVEVSLAVRNVPPRPTADFRGDIPRAVDDILERCFEKRRADRFPSARDLANALFAAAATPAATTTLLRPGTEGACPPGTANGGEETASTRAGGEEPASTRTGAEETGALAAPSTPPQRSSRPFRRRSSATVPAVTVAEDANATRARIPVTSPVPGSGSGRDGR